MANSTISMGRKLKQLRREYVKESKNLSDHGTPATGETLRDIQSRLYSLLIASTAQPGNKMKKRHLKEALGLFNAISTSLAFLDQKLATEY